MPQIYLTIGHKEFEKLSKHFSGSLVVLEFSNTSQKYSTYVCVCLGILNIHVRDVILRMKW